MGYHYGYDFGFLNFLGFIAVIAAIGMAIGIVVTVLFLFWKV